MASTDSKSTGIAQQIPRTTLALLMVAQVVVIAPLSFYISLWVVGVCLFCGYWRTQVYRGRWGFPPSWVKAVLVMASFLGIALSGYRTFTLEAATSLLVLAFALKLVEMRNRRDAYLVIYLSYFLVATAFLFNQSMSMAAYEMIAMIVVTAALVGLNQLQSKVRPLASARTAAGLVLQALPLTLVLFMLFPRIGPLWSIPMPSAATTGLSDRLTPGDIASLSQSDELAFRVVFDDNGDIPRQRDLYWRGLTYSQFAYGTWTVGEPLPEQARADEVQLDGISYQVFLEPTQSRWLYSLDAPVDYDARMALLGDYRLLNQEPVLSVLRYRVTSDAERPLDQDMTRAMRIRETALPPRDNPRMRQYARNLRQQTGSTQGMIDAILAEIREREFHYTLSPPSLGRQNSVDEFWFDSRRGFCTHYAGAMVFTLRAAGIPARMVGGYQGGEINPVTGHMVVRQYQAHSWVEVWQEAQGWVRYDPTAEVAPERVESGLNAALSAEDRATLSLFSNARMGEGGLINNLLNLADSLEYQWNLWVVGYDAATQAGVLKEWLGNITPARIGIAILIGGAASLLLVGVNIFAGRRPQRRHPIEKLLQDFGRRMQKLGLPRAPDEPPHSYIHRLAGLAGVNGDALAASVQAAVYDPDQAVTLLRRQTIRQDLRKLQFRLAIQGVKNAS